MAVAMGQVICPSNADTLIVGPSSSTVAESAAGALRRTVILNNPSAQGIYIGTSAETAATGFLLAANSQPISIPLDATEALYGRGASASPTLHYIESGS